MAIDQLVCEISNELSGHCHAFLILWTSSLRLYRNPLTCRPLRYNGYRCDSSTSYSPVVENGHDCYLTSHIIQASEDDTRDSTRSKATIRHLHWKPRVSWNLFMMCVEVMYSSLRSQCVRVFTFALGYIISSTRRTKPICDCRFTEMAGLVRAVVSDRLRIRLPLLLVRTVIPDRLRICLPLLLVRAVVPNGLRSRLPPLLVWAVIPDGLRFSLSLLLVWAVISDRTGFSLLLVWAVVPDRISSKYFWRDDGIRDGLWYRDCRRRCGEEDERCELHICGCAVRSECVSKDG